MMIMVSMASLLLLLGGVVGCSVIEVREVEVDSYSVPATPIERRFPLSAALVLDSGLKTYAVKHELVPFAPFEVSATAAYQVGPHLERYARDVAASMFKDVRNFDTVTEAATKCDVVLVPKAVRSSTHITTPFQVMIVVEWQVLDRSGRDLIWLTSVESHSSVKPGIFAHGKARREAYTLVLSDLVVKTIASFQASPEVRAISTQREVK